MESMDCSYCGKSVPQTLHIIEDTEPRIFIELSASMIEIYDEQYPGFQDGFAVNYCPMCGRKLKGE